MSQKKICSNCGTADFVEVLTGCIYVCHKCDNREHFAARRNVSVVFTKSCKLISCGCPIKRQELLDFSQALQDAISKLDYKSPFAGLDGPTIIRNIPWEIDWIFLSYGYQIVRKGVIIRDSRRSRLACWQLSYNCSECRREEKQE